MALTEAQSLAKYGTVSYTAWGEAEAQADWNAKHGGNTPISTATPQPTLQPISTPAPNSTGGGQPGEAQLIQAMMQKGHTEATARGAISGRGVADLAREYGVPIGTSTGALQGLTAQPTIDLPKIYESLYSSSGISDLEKDLSAKEKEFTESKAGVNENPFLSEATRVGRIAKLEQLFTERTANLRSDIARKKADVETSLNLQMKQFDINSQQAQQALSQFNSLLGLGALSNASGEDIANIARSTGLSTSMIDAAIQASTEVEPKIMNTDNGFVLINPQTGDIIKSQTVPGMSGGGGGTATERELSRFQQLLIQDVKNGLTLRDAIALYGDTLGLADITQLYNQYSIYGPAKESGQEIQSIYKQAGKSTGGSFSNNFGFD